MKQIHWTTAIEVYLREMSQSAATFANYSTILRLFFADRTDPALVTALDVQRFIAAPTKRGRAPSPQTIQCRLSPIRGFYSRAVAWGLIDRDPTTGVKRPKLGATMPRGFTIQQVRTFLEAVFDCQRGRPVGQERALRNRAAFAVGFLTGLRLHEITSLTAGHLQSAYPTADGGAYVVQVTKGRKQRKIYFPPPALNAIKDYIAATDRILSAMEPGESIWQRLSDSTLRLAVMQTARHAGLGHVTTHTMRHTAARLRRAAGADIEEVSSFLGHSQIGTTSIYLKRLDPETDERWQDVAKLIGL